MTIATNAGSARGRRLPAIALFAALALPALAQPGDPFPRPPEIEPAVNFWLKVYTEVNTGNGYLHDARNLAVIYETVSRNQRDIDRARSRIQEDLRVLASGRRDGLSGRQREILALFPAGADNETFRNAAANVRFQLGQSDRFLAGLKRSGAYRGHIGAVIREKGLPRELGILPHVESSFNPLAVSSASASGMWQFGRATGQRFMRIDHIVDERMDPYLATYAAMSLLEYNYSILGTWPLALTAYNHGAGGMRRAVRETGTTDIEKIIANYRGRLFGFASRNFYAQFLAVLQIENNLERYFGEVRMDPVPDFRELRLDSFVDARSLAGAFNVSFEQLRADNPALRPAVWEGNKRIPAGFPVKLRAGRVPEGDLLALVPGELQFAIQTPDVAYVVERGDSLSRIAERFDTSVSRLVALNQLPNRHRIAIGQRLLLPQDNAAAAASPARASAPAPPVLVAAVAETAAAPEPEPASIPEAELEPGPEPKPEPARLARNEPILPPAAVLPDDQVLDTPATSEDDEAPAIDPASDIEQSNRILAESLAADPSDYSVDGGNRIEIQASETLGHYAEWLGVRASDLRRLNNMAFRDPVIIGERLRLDFSRASVAEFERARREFHSRLQREFFGDYHIQGVTSHTVRPNENISSLAGDRYSTPIWLLRQYNPGLELNSLRIGQEIAFPRLSPVQ
ncbi:MAG: LysM peptidoglycan-binding domain-containing protein [Gammaproteobacteria bacterium]|nr:LysM peptidoglycan-binding domain-containing protein [Gammaproteobacteria bacterium]